MTDELIKKAQKLIERIDDLDDGVHASVFSEDFDLLLDYFQYVSGVRPYPKYGEEISIRGTPVHKINFSNPESVGGRYVSTIRNA